ncbi:glutamate-1-semialdehyde 2,1-aminomutase [Dubosiella newyorkensis]|uniref:glutamate-1-semialdehyde 2,1-aminomutase n=1 Tax=Dubosiella newyorkensis TaxID=1862672 RepID=UPI0032B2B90D
MLKNNHDLYEEAKQYIPGGVNSPVRAFQAVGCDPIFIRKAQGAHLFAEDGRHYIDYIASWGPMLLGHGAHIINEAIEAHIKDGISYGLPSWIEVEVAKRIVEAYPGVDEVRMVNSGTEATMSAIRLARGYTRKDKIIKFEGCYHGHSDGLLVSSGSGALTFGVPTSPGVPEDVVKNTLVATYNDLDSVKALIDANPDAIAGLIVEPVCGNMGVVSPEPGFLEGLRELCTKHSIVLIFDEVITGFRISYEGAAGYYGIVPDLACFGKIIGAGFPVGAYGGKKEIMACVSPSGPVYQAGTLSGNPLAMQAGKVMLDYLKHNPAVYDLIEEKGAYLQTHFQKILDANRLPFTLVRNHSLMTLFFMDSVPHDFKEVQRCDTKKYAKYFKGMLERRILLAPSQFEAMFISSALTKNDMDVTIQAFKEVMEEFRV